MSCRRRTPEQMIRKLAEGLELLVGGMTVEKVFRPFPNAGSTRARSVGQSGGMPADDKKRLKRATGSALNSTTVTALLVLGTGGGPGREAGRPT